jgi:uncharacterized membrane protein (DUF2068 family)
MGLNPAAQMEPVPNPAEHSRRKTDAETEVLRAIATFELIKGLVVLLAGFGALSLYHRDVWDVANSLLHLLHIKHHYHYADVFLRLADGVTNRELIIVAAVAALYSTLRFVEAYGLWRKRVWAEWFACVSGALYLPFEVNEIFRRFTAFKLALFLANLGIVVYMLYLRVMKRENKPAGA